jgi:tetraacyldisaccharide 4'-kinase
MSLRTARLLSSIWYGGNPLRWLLWPLSLAYRAAAALRRAAYRFGVARIVVLPVPVIVIGNISVGGTGKTPLIIWLAGRLEERGLAVGIVSRGYRGRARDWPRYVTAESDPDMFGDEPVLIARRTLCPVVAGPDRVAAARRLLAEAPVDVLLSDDGLQHYRLGRRLEIVVVDGVRGMGNGLCLPAGPLREPASRLEQVDAVVVNGGAWGAAGAFRARLAASRVRRIGKPPSDSCGPSRAEADGRARNSAPRAPAVAGEVRSLDDFRGQTVHAVAGIGHPDRFFALLEGAGLKVIPHPLDDHARFGPHALRFREPGPVLVTEKDAVKCRNLPHDDLWCVCVDLEFAAADGERLLRLVMGNLTPVQPESV